MSDQPLFHTANHTAHRQELGSTLSQLTDKCASNDPDSHLGDNILLPAHTKDPNYDPEKQEADSSKAESDGEDKSGTSSWHNSLKKFLHAGMTRLTSDAAYYHYGNYVINRSTGARKFEQMPLYTRIGMHILYHGTIEESLLSDGYAQKLFTSESIKMGKHFDSPESKPKIAGFVKQFNLELDDLAEPDITKYACFNDFFARGLKAGARPVAEPQDDSVIVSSADCRLVVFESIDLATEYWIKGKKFTLPNLINPTSSNSLTAPPSDTISGPDSSTKADTSSMNSKFKDLLSPNPSSSSSSPSHLQVDPENYNGGAIAIFRLAPQDYHRWHSPISGTVLSIVDIPGTLMTVNPMAINEDLNVYTQNKRSICTVLPDHSKIPVLIVAIGAMLVGSIKWSLKPHQSIKKGEEMGEFRYGGSTCLFITPKELGCLWDEDLVGNSKPKSKSGRASETQVRVGERIGRFGR